MKLKQVAFVFAPALWIFPGLMLALGSLVNCTYTIPTIDGSSAAGGKGGNDGDGGIGGALSCSTGWTSCDDLCVDTMTDSAHCGMCDAPCGPGIPCTNGKCGVLNSACTAGEKKPCYNGPPGTESVGSCKAGEQVCLPDETGYGPCTNEVGPTQDVCGNGDDEDCNGSPAKGALCLTSAGLVVRYILDEAETGKKPMMALDSAPEPLDLTLEYGGFNNMIYTEAATGRGLRWFIAGGSGTAYAPIDGTKVYTALDGKTQGTIEIVAKLEAVSGSSSRIFTLGMGGESGRFTLSSSAIDRLQFRWQEDVIAGDWPVAFLSVGRCVLHLVLDTAQVNEDDRLRLYLNGQLVAGNTGVKPMQNQKINIEGGRSLYLGNRGEYIRSFAGALYYAALYARPLSDNEITQHTSFLVDNDDK